MTIEFQVDNPKEVFKSLAGKELELKNGNLQLGTLVNLRMQKGKLVGDAEIKDMEVFKNYGSKAFVAGFPVEVRK